MVRIEFYQVDDDPRELVSKVKYDTSRSLADLFLQKEHAVMDQFWSERGKDLWDNPLGNLWDTQDSITYIDTRFRFYDALGSTNSLQDKPFREELYEKSRAASVGIAVTTRDGYVVVQRRSLGSLLAPDKLDSSAAGMVVAKEEELDFNGIAIAKTCKELAVHESQVSLVATGIHSSSDHCSSMITYKGTVNVPFSELGAGEKWVGELIAVKEDELSDYIVEHFANTQELIGDGAATLLRSLDDEKFVKAIMALREKGCDLVAGTLVDGSFVESYS